MTVRARRFWHVWYRYVCATYLFLALVNVLVTHAPPFSVQSGMDSLLLGSIVFALAEVLATDDRSRP